MRKTQRLKTVRYKQLVQFDKLTDHDFNRRGLCLCVITHLPHPKLSHNEKWSFGDLRLAIAT